MKPRETNDDDKNEEEDDDDKDKVHHDVPVSTGVARMMFASQAATEASSSRALAPKRGSAEIELQEEVDPSPRMVHRSSVTEGGINMLICPSSPIAMAPVTVHSPRHKTEAEKRGSVWSSVINLTATAMGAGMLSMPHAFAQTGVIGGLVLLLISAGLGDIGLVWLVTISRATEKTSFEGNADYYFGSRGRKSLNTTLIVMLFGACVAIFTIVLSLIPHVIRELLNCGSNECQTIFLDQPFIGIVAVSAISYFLMQDTLHELRLISFVALGGLGYYFIVLVTTFAARDCDRNWISSSNYSCDDYSNNAWCTTDGHVGPKWNPKWGVFDDYGINGLNAYFCPQCGCTDATVPKIHPSVKMIGTFSECLMALPVMLSAYMCQFNIFKIDHELKADHRKYINGIIHVTFFLTTTVSYAIGGLIGYFTFGETVMSNILDEYRSYTMTIAGGCIALTNLTKLPLLFIPLRQSIQEFCQVQPMEYRWVISIILLLTTFSAAWMLQSLSKALEISGVTAGSIISYIFPGFLYYKFVSSASFTIPLLNDYADQEEDLAQLSDRDQRTWRYYIHPAKGIAMAVFGVVFSIIGLTNIIIHWDTA